MTGSRGDFSADRRLLWLALWALPVGAIGAVMALVLLRLIGLFTNLFYFHRFATELRPPGASDLGLLMLLVPVAGGLVIGLMARYGSDRIRGHGIPEAMEAILFGKSRMQPKVAVLKPLSSAIVIGSGGPFGAEGPIIMTAGALGSILAQTLHLTASERKTLLVAGAAAGMTATFNTPAAAVLLAVELLLFEWRPKSFVPVAVASAMAAALRPFLLGSGALFPVPLHATLPPSALASAAVAGLGAGVLSAALTAMVYLAEDGFGRLPLHWMWWPAIGGAIIAAGGWIEPRALGVGYDLIDKLLVGDYVARDLVGLMLVKAAIWALALGSGTSGGVLAPLLILGGALGGLEAAILPGGDRALWPLVGMAAALGGTMRSPLTGVVFALELTHDVAALPALLIAATVAHAFTVLTMRRSILTEKVARRGHHVHREYTVDPLELTPVSEVMTAAVVAVPASLGARALFGPDYLGGERRHQGYPVVDDAGRPLGMITRRDLLDAADLDSDAIIAADLMRGPAASLEPWQSCRVAAERMAQAGIGRIAVVDGDRLVGIVTLTDLLTARRRRLDEERARERPIDLSRSAPRRPPAAAP
jgi:H+/Cl- antiporter ClcA